MSAILFDMDGTLVDSEPLWFQAEKQVMAEVGSTWEQSDQINCLGGPMEKTERYMQERSGNIKPFGYFSERLNDVMDEKLKHELKLMPSALELLLDCKSAQIPSITGVQSGLRAGAQVIGIPHLVQLQPHENLRVVKALSDLSLNLIFDWYPHLDRSVSIK